MLNHNFFKKCDASKNIEKPCTVTMCLPLENAKRVLENSHYGLLHQPSQITSCARTHAFCSPQLSICSGIVVTVPKKTAMENAYLRTFYCIAVEMKEIALLVNLTGRRGGAGGDGGEN